MRKNRTISRCARAVLSAILFPAFATAAATNQPPAAPLITEPATDGLTLNPADVHMETAPFSDPDPGDQHLCTDWEIWRLTPQERVWYSAGATGVHRVHTHFGDGTFENSHAGQTSLAVNTDFFLRVRHSDDSGDPTTRWSPWSQRGFHTGTAMQIFPLELDDIASAPVPRWLVTSDGSNVVLPTPGTPPYLRLGSADGLILLTIEPNDGLTNRITNPPALAHHVPVRLEIGAGSRGLLLPQTDLLVVDDHCETHRILVPALWLTPGVTLFAWISTAGATYVGSSWGTSPDFTTPLRGLSPPWFPLQRGFKVEVFAGDLTLPVNIAFVPNPGPNPTDPFLYVTELYGTIKVVTRNRTVSNYATGLLNFDPPGDFPGDGEMGLAGIAVDPLTGDVYAGMLYAGVANPSFHFPKIVRFTSTDGGASAASQTTILDMVNERQEASHQISNLTITPDRKLLCHMGDGFDASTAPDLESFRGKILRLNLDGTPPPDNPFFDASDGITARDYIFAYGLRNPFGGDWRAADGKQYEVENGPNVDRFARIVPGRNFGWDGTNASMANFAITNWSPAHAPVNLAFVQPETFGGSGFPASMMGHAFVAEAGPTYATGPQLRGKRISEWILDATGNLVAGPIPFLEYAGHGRSTACGLEAGPDGLYMTELYYDLSTTGGATPGARILRITFDPPDDCNGNGLDDVCDIVNSTSADANGNSIPDECESVVLPFCFGDGTGIPCPCSNTGQAGHGCANSSAGSGGALLAWSGTALLTADTLLLTASGELPTSLSMFWQGDAERPPIAFGDGLACAGGHLKRLYFHSAVAGIVVGPQGSDPKVSARSAALGNPITPGTIRLYHVFYRDPDPNFCPAPAGSTLNTTNGLKILWGA